MLGFVERALGWLFGSRPLVVPVAFDILTSRLGGRAVATTLAARQPGEVHAVAIPDMAGQSIQCGASLSAHVTSGRAIFRLSAQDGEVVDQVVCPPRAAAWNIVLFGSARAGLRVVVLPDGEGLAVKVGAVTAWCFDPAVAAPANLVPRPSLAPVSGWSRVYGDPDVEDILGRLRARVFAALPAVTRVPWINGLETLLEPGDELSRAIMISGLYEPETMCVIRDRLAPGGVFIDVGAHCGMFTLFAARHVGPAGRVVAFEPSAREFARLQAQVAHNHLANVETHRLAVADARGTVHLRLAEPGHAGHNTIGSGFAYPGVKIDRIDAVEATTLDIALAGLARCDVIKMDIEGAELRALMGAEQILARFRPVLVLEVFDTALAGSGATVAGLLGWCAARGYTPYDIDAATSALVPARITPNESKNVVFLPAD